MGLNEIEGMVPATTGVSVLQLPIRPPRASRMRFLPWVLLARIGTGA